MKYCFLDIETTGLDTRLDTILEISWLFTDEKFDKLTEPRTFLVDQEDWSTTHARIRENREVFDMHTKSGLLSDLMRSRDDEVRDLDFVYDMLWNDLYQQGASRDAIHLSGRSVHFDKSFLVEKGYRYLFGDSMESFHHRMLDLSAVNLFLASAGYDLSPLQVVNNLPHRAMHDIVADVQYAKNLRDYLDVKEMSL